MNKFLYIYTFYSTDPCRLRNFTASIEQLKTVDPEADICVVEQNGLTSIPEVTFHHRVDIDDANFHKTALLNFAVANHPDYTHYVMIDADSWIDAGVVDNIHNHCDDAPLVFPYETCVYLSEAQTRRKCRHDAVDIPLRYNSNIPITRQTGLINCFSKETYQQVGGFDEEFVGWGAEDDAFVFKIRRVTGKRELRCKGGAVLHLWHKKVNDRSYLEGLRYKKNRAYCSLIRRMTDDEFKRYLSHETTLDEIYKDFAARGGIEGDATLIIGPSLRLNVNTSIYYVPTLTPTMTEFLTEVLAEDGPDVVKNFVNSYATEKYAYPEVLKEVEAFYEKHGITND